MKNIKKILFSAIALMSCVSCELSLQNSNNSFDVSNNSLAPDTSISDELSANSNSQTDTSTQASVSAVTSDSTTILVNSLTLEKSSLNLDVGKTATIAYTILPENATNKLLRWSSSHSEIATVDANGLVRANATGSTTITANTTDGSNISANCVITVNEPQSDTWSLITNVNDLNDGDLIVLANSANSVVAGQLSSGYLKAVESTFSSDSKSITALANTAISFTLGKNGTNFTLANPSGELLGTTAAKKVAWENGTTTWKISITTNGDATITSTQSTYGSIYYNSQNPRFTTYTSSGQNKIQIYRGKAAEPVYPESLQVTGVSNMIVGETYQFNVTFAPTNTNVTTVTWESSNEEFATVTNTGLVTPLKEGKVTITVTAQDKNANIIKDNIDIDIKIINVTGITLKESSLEMAINKTQKLTANVLPANASNKKVNWTSSETRIASITDDGTITALMPGTTTITATTVDGGYIATCNVEVKETILDDYTIMIYMCGSDLESSDGLATANITEILAVNNMPDTVNVIIQTGGAKKWDSKYRISANYLERWHVEDKQLIKDSQLAKASMGSSSTFQSFLEWGLTSYPANKTGVIFWDHGGAMQGCCYDENFNDDVLTNSEVNSALKNAFNAVGRTEKLEWVGYDCCLMAVADIASTNSDYFNYMVSSQESEPGEGWDYDNWLKEVFNNPKIETSTLLNEIVDTFVSKCATSYNSYGGQWRGYNDATLSVLDLSYAPAFCNAWETMASNLSKIITSSSQWTTFASKILNECQQFGYDEDYGYSFDVFDLQDFINCIKKNSTYSAIGIEEVETALNDLIIYNVYGKDSSDACGLCLFAPTSNWTAKSDYTASDTKFSTWRNLVLTYGKWYK